MIKAVLLPFLQPALKRQGRWSGQAGRRAGGVRAPSPSPPPGRAAEGAAPAAGRGGGGERSRPGVSLSSSLLISGCVHSLRSSQRGLFWHGNVPSGIY